MKKKNPWPMRLVVCGAAVVFAFSGWRLYGIYAEYKAGTDMYDDTAEQFVHVKSAEASESAEAEEVTVDFEALVASNDDVVAWIRCEDTLMNYPVVQSGDNSYYLRRMLNGKYNIAGTIFMDYRNAADLSDLNTIIYGHNMKNGSMFGSLLNYRDQSYYEAHPTLELHTPAGEYQLHAIAGFTTPADSEVYRFFESNEELKAYLKWAVSKSNFTSARSLEDVDRIVTLSTCSYAYDDARYVLIGALEKGGSADE